MGKVAAQAIMSLFEVAEGCQRRSTSFTRP
jgi:hypothetical protein